MDPLVSGQGLIFRNRNRVMAMSQLMFARCPTPSGPGSWQRNALNAARPKSGS